MADLSFVPASGNVNVAGNWDLGVVPTAVDIARVAAAKAATVPAGVTFQAEQIMLTPTAGTTALTVAATAVVECGNASTLLGGLTLTASASSTVPGLINNGTIRSKGNLQHALCPVQLGPDSLVEFDRNTTHGGQPQWSQGTANSQGNTIILTSGTDAVHRATVRSSATGSGLKAKIVAGFLTGTGKLQCRSATFRDLTTVEWANDATSSTGTFLDDCLVDGCGQFTGKGNIVVGAALNIRRSVFQNCTDTQSINVTGVATSGITASRQIYDNFFDKKATFSTAFDFQGNIFYDTSTSAPLNLLSHDSVLGWDRNWLVKSSAGALLIYFGPNLGAGVADRTILTYATTTAGFHGLTFGAPTFTSYTVTLRRWFFDGAGFVATSNLQGENIDLQAPTTAVTPRFRIENCISGTTPAGKGLGRLARITGAPSNGGVLEVELNHNTHVSGSDVAPGVSGFNAMGALLSYGDTAAVVPDHTVKSFKSNIAVIPAGGAGGSLAARGLATNATSEIIDPAGVAKNAGYGLGSAPEEGFGWGRGTGAARSFPSVTDVSQIAVLNADPQFPDIYRTTISWDLALGGPGTVDHAIRECAKQRNPEATWNSAYSFDNALAYFFGGFQPRAGAYNDAHDKLSPTTPAGTWIGAVEGSAAASTTRRRRLRLRRD
jgi:hypothetical protein